jgi:hypothetical protein
MSAIVVGEVLLVHVRVDLYGDGARAAPRASGDVERRRGEVCELDQPRLRQEKP